jgi:hypothetical protein
MFCLIKIPFYIPRPMAGTTNVGSAPSLARPIKKISLSLLLIIQCSVEFLCDGHESACADECGFQSPLGCR